ncbi:hypothetical protein GmHk_10G028223 [Glycine max]|nr:hypothetical protein GmHk_10G028223 [Glycine max]
MVTTRGLGRALGRVIGRALGREVSGDADEAPQRRRPTTSAHRQWEAAPIDEDVERLDYAVDEIQEQPEGATTDDAVTHAEGFLGRPHDTSFFMDYVHHVAVTVWNEEEHSELKLSSHGRKVEKFGRPAPKIEDLVATIGLSPLIACSLDTNDRRLISAFAESFETLHVDEVVNLLVELLEKKQEPIHYNVKWHMFGYPGCETFIVANVMQHSCTLFANKSATHVHVVFLDAFRDLIQIRSYAWGVAALVHMYEN